MKTPSSLPSRKLSLLCGLLLFLDTPRMLLGEPPATATAAFQQYSQAVEARLVQQHRSPQAFLVYQAGDNRSTESRMRAGEVLIEPLTPSASAGFSGAMLHHWRGTAFAPGGTAADFEKLMRDFKSYPQHFSPDVLDAKTLTQNGDHMQAWMRIRQRHVITVVLDTSYDIAFGRLDARHGYSISESTHIAEMEGVGTSHERALSESNEHGFLWRQNTYWSYEERDGGLYLQVESVSLTRSIPAGLGWAVRPYVESIPHESLEFTLRSASAAITKKQ